MRVEAEHTWNDRIDPNGQYVTDRVKSTIAEIITFGQADPYNISISWPAETQYIVQPDGTISAYSGWPS